jgi:hypothetical protein
MRMDLLTVEETETAVQALMEYKENGTIPKKIIYQLSESSPKRIRKNSGYTKLCLSAKKRNLDITLTSEEYDLLIKKPCTYCGGNLSLAGYGIDRIDHKYGYLFDNCTACCDFCNYIKGDRLTFKETLVVINAIQKYRISKSL